MRPGRCRCACAAAARPRLLPAACPAALRSLVPASSHYSQQIRSRSHYSSLGGGYLRNGVGGGQGAPAPRPMTAHYTASAPQPTQHAGGHYTAARPSSMGRSQQGGAWGGGGHPSAMSTVAATPTAYASSGAAPQPSYEQYGYPPQPQQPPSQQQYAQQQWVDANGYAQQAATHWGASGGLGFASQ